MPDDNRANEALRDFIDELNAAWEAAGPPSYARLEKLSIAFSSSEQAGSLRLRVLAASTTHEILRGKRRSLPEWGWVVSFVNVLRVAAIENGLNADVVGTIAEWKAKHQQARLVIRAAGPPPDPPAPDRDQEGGADPPDDQRPPGIGPRVVASEQARRGRPAKDPQQAVRFLGRAARAGHPSARPPDRRPSWRVA
jgi:hypothetical protein